MGSGGSILTERAPLGGLRFRLPVNSRKNVWKHTNHIYTQFT